MRPSITVPPSAAGTRPQAAIPGFFPLLAPVRAVREHMRCRDDYRTLMQLSDYLLEDIGADRERIARAARRSPL